MYPTIHIGNLAFPTAGLLYIAGAFLCLSVIEQAALRLRQNQAEVYALATAVLFSGIIGARLFFVADYWAAFRANPLTIIWPLNTGYNLAGGLVVGLVVGFFYGRYKQLPPLATLDALIPGVITLLAIISLADFLAGPGYGVITNMPWGVSQFGIRRHPVQLYEVAAALAALFAWWRLHPGAYAPGWLFFATTAVYTAGRLLVDAYRANAWTTPGGWHIVQIACLIILLLSLLWLMLKDEGGRMKDEIPPRSGSPNP